MKPGILLAAGSLALGGGIALAQGGDDPIARLRTCSLLGLPDRLECLDKLSRAITPAAVPAADGDGWIISQTRSPVDYSALATATLSSREVAGRGSMQLSIRCRDGRTEISVAGSAVSGRPDDYAISYRVDGGQPVHIAAGPPAFGPGVAFRVDAGALIQSLPGDGEFDLSLSPRVGPSLQASFSLAGLDNVRKKITFSCKWPHAIAKPNN
ncbi:MAG: hypothetical protein JOZ58_06300 [Acetobacteraceae bacterium]|nr:hypothetical protein [Acetobacteraceae bacterium]